MSLVNGILEVINQSISFCLFVFVLQMTLDSTDWSLCSIGALFLPNVCIILCYWGSVPEWQHDAQYCSVTKSEMAGCQGETIYDTSFDFEMMLTIKAPSFDL